MITESQVWGLIVSGLVIKSVICQFVSFEPLLYAYCCMSSKSLASICYFDTCLLRQDPCLVISPGDRSSALMMGSVISILSWILPLLAPQAWMLFDNRSIGKGCLRVMYISHDKDPVIFGIITNGLYSYRHISWTTHCNEHDVIRYCKYCNGRTLISWLMFVYSLKTPTQCAAEGYMMLHLAVNCNCKITVTYIILIF